MYTKCWYITIINNVKKIIVARTKYFYHTLASSTALLHTFTCIDTNFFFSALPSVYGLFFLLIIVTVHWFLGKMSQSIWCIKIRDNDLFDRITSDTGHVLYDLLLPKRNRTLGDRRHDFMLPRVRTERFNRAFVNRCLFRYVSWYPNFCNFVINMIFFFFFFLA